MVWACFASNIRRPLVSFRAVNTAVTYMDALQENLLPFIDALPLNIKNIFIFQQDNATIHTARVTQNWFQENNITIMEWPPNSPNMNPIVRKAVIL